MSARIERTLSRVIALSKDLTPQSDVVVLSTRGAEMRILWESFERQSDDLHLVGTPEFQGRVEAFIASLHTAVAGTEAAREEQNQMRLVEVLGAGSSGRGILNIINQYNPAPLLDQFRNLLIQKGREATALLEDLRLLSG